MARLRTMIVGAGLMGRWHAHAARRVGARVVAVVDADPSRADGLARRHPGAVAHATLEGALGESAEVAHICTPSATHEALIRCCLEASVHVVSEKPLVEGAATTEALLRLAEARGRILVPTHQVLFQHGVRRASVWLGGLAPLTNLEVVICSAGGVGRAGYALDAVVAEILPHPLALFAQFLPSPLEDVQFQRARPAPGELILQGSARGVGLRILVSLSARPPEFALTLRTPDATIRCDLFHGFSTMSQGGLSSLAKFTRPGSRSLRELLAWGVNSLRRVRHREAAYPGLHAFMAAVHRSVLLGGPPPILAATTLTIARARDRILSHLPAV